MLDEFSVDKLKQIKAKFDALQAELDAARARIAELEAAQRWVPVGERLPEIGKIVWAIDAHGEMVSAWLDPYKVWRFELEPGCVYAINVVYWQTLPAAPEVEE